MSQKVKIETTQTFYDRIADVHNLAMKINGYRSSVAKFLGALDLNIDSDSLVLDAGSGTGIVTQGFYSAGFRPKQTVALDLSLNSLKVSREEIERDEEAGGENITEVQGNILKLPFADETFDLVLTCGVLEYVPLEEGLNEMARVLKAGARLVLIPVKPSLVGSILEIIYNFKTHPIKKVKKVAARHFKIIGDYQFPITEPISWSKMIFLLEKK
ncbi:MAG TPA: class I SAM-dependent methyltransferase [Pyrinomonadaceae bacterium]|jgi:ubiquinone/menaquinone biosynthesis C-methylase UbiE